jgi:hypothetical protein
VPLGFTTPSCCTKRFDRVASDPLYWRLQMRIMKIPLSGGQRR